jgi:hypothetical protein
MTHRWRPGVVWCGFTRLGPSTATIMSAPIHLECDLRFIIERCGITSPAVVRRLNGIENTLTALARRWRPERLIQPATDLRMADETRLALLAWIGADLPDAAALGPRLSSYIGGVVRDDGVPPGWIRLRLDVPVDALARPTA